MKRILAVAFAATVLLLVLGATLLPTSDDIIEASLCLVCSARGIADAILNVALFMPVGVALAVLMRPARAIVAGVILSCAIEIGQLWVPGRHSSMGDLAFNTTGTIAGVLLLAALPWLLRPSRRAATALALGWAALVASVLFGGLWLMRPALPATNYYGQWTARLGSYAFYDGRVTDARLGSLPLPSWRLNDSDTARAAMRAGVPLEVTAIAGNPPPAVAPIFSMADGEERQIMLLGADRSQLVFRYQTRAMELRLDSPDLRVDGAFAGLAPGDTIMVRATPAAGGRAMRFVVNGREAEVRLGLADTWGLLLTSDYVSRSRKLRRAIGIGWLLALAAPLVWWSARALRPERAS